MINAQAAPILKAFSSLSLKLLVAPGLAYTSADATSYPATLSAAAMTSLMARAPKERETVLAA